MRLHFFSSAAIANSKMDYSVYFIIKGLCFTELQTTALVTYTKVFVKNRPYVRTCAPSC